jgi:hypothetical protein
MYQNGVYLLLHFGKSPNRQLLPEIKKKHAICIYILRYGVDRNSHLVVSLIEKEKLGEFKTFTLGQQCCGTKIASKAAITAEYIATKTLTVTTIR